MNYKNESLAEAQAVITPDLRKSNKIAKQSQGSRRRTSSKLRSAAREAREPAREGAGSISSQVGSPGAATRRYVMNANSLGKARPQEPHSL